MNPPTPLPVADPLDAPRDPTDARVLIVDDGEDNLVFLETLLRRRGYRNLATSADPREALERIRDHEPDIVLLDLMMPHLDGFEVMARIRAMLPDDSYLPILVLTADASPEVRRRALREGAMDFLTKPLDAIEVVQRTRNLLHTRLLHTAQRAHRDRLEQLVQARTAALAQANEELHGLNEALGEANAEILQRLARAAEYRDDDTGRHTLRVGQLAMRTARRLGLPEGVCALIERAARLHDLGKIGIPDSILLKPGRLDDDERRTMQRHCEIGAGILDGSRSELLQVARSIVLSHHERWDGAGYPHGLHGEAIPIEGRIVAVVDVFDALTHSRPYKRAWTLDEAIRVLAEERGRHFDPEVVDAFLAVIDELGRDPGAAAELVELP